QEKRERWGQADARAAPGGAHAVVRRGEVRELPERASDPEPAQPQVRVGRLCPVRVEERGRLGRVLVLRGGDRVFRLRPDRVGDHSALDGNPTEPAGPVAVTRRVYFPGARSAVCPVTVSPALPVRLNTVRPRASITDNCTLAPAGR